MAISTSYAVAARSLAGTFTLAGTTDAAALEAVRSADTDSGGDTVTISEQARKLSSQRVSLTSGNAKDDSDDDSQSDLNVIRQRIKDLQQRIQEIEKSDLPEKEKEQKLQLLRDQLSECVQQMNKMNQAVGPMGGTAAQGFANSLT
uniref:FlxA-like protein n=1 Tax=Fundidesulfovibrio putealis TaxID=270496 RepID=A0A7C4EJ96_9BACT